MKHEEAGQEVTDAKKPRIQTAARTSMVLQEVARAGSKGITAKDIADHLDLPRQIVYHLVHTLVSINMLRRGQSNSYVLGLAVASIAHGFRKQLSSSDSIQDIAREAAEITGESSYVVGWLDDEIVVLSSARGSAAIAATVLSPGTAGNAHARASGKLLLAMSGKDEVERYLQKHGMTRLTQNTITNRREFSAELKRIEQNWVSYDNEEYALGLSCMALPLGRVPTPLAIGVSAPTDRFKVNALHYEEQLRMISSRFEPAIEK
jgi:IclR family acetate operon transcriptional repressor